MVFRWGLLRPVLAASIAVVCVAAFPAAALGFAMMTEETGTVDVSRWEGTNNCVNCHGTTPFGYYDRGPHGMYGGALKRCQVCHELHDAPGPKLLPGSTIKETCEVCHDGTGGFGVYGTIVARGLTVGADHSIDATSLVPGGDASTGGGIVREFVGENDFLGCDDCHSPHNARTITTAFRGDRLRNQLTDNIGVTEHLLRQKPTSAVASTTEYGSDWCAGCHRGRSSGGAVHNHPVDSSATHASPFHYGNVARLTTDDPTGVTVMGTMGRTNRGFLMPVPRTAEQDGHAPICQQCHEDAREPGTLSGATADAEPFVLQSVDGTIATDNPRFQTFPHESLNPYFLVETNDDLCLNCHTSAQLP